MIQKFKNYSVVFLLGLMVMLLFINLINDTYDPTLLFMVIGLVLVIFIIPKGSLVNMLRGGF